MGPLVLVVEDDPDNLASMIDVLEEEGYEVLPARSGQEARDRLASADPSLIIIDYLLPDMTGAELLRLVRQRDGPAVPVLILTATSQPLEGALDVPVLTKPVMLDRLLEVLRQLCAPQPAAQSPV